MSKQKIAGVDRPYTPTDLGGIIDGFIEEGDWDNKACLDYHIPEHHDERELTSEDFEIFSITTFGTTEGIYTDFYIKYYGKEKISLLTAKTLHESEEAYIKMHEMAAHICYKFNKFVDANIANFFWSGFSLSFIDEDGKECDHLICGSMESVAFHGNELLKKGALRVFYVDNYSRKKYEYKNK